MGLKKVGLHWHLVEDMMILQSAVFKPNYLSVYDAIIQYMTWQVVLDACNADIFNIVLSHFHSPLFNQVKVEIKNLFQEKRGEKGSITSLLQTKEF